MAVAENLRIAHSVRDEVKVVDGKVERVEDKVEDVGDKVEVIGDKLEVIDDKLDDIDDKVQCVDEKVQVAIDGTRGMSSQSQIPPNIFTSDGKQAIVAAKEANLILQQTATNVDKIKCS